MSLEARQALVAKLIFQDEHNGTAEPTQRADLLDPALTDTGLIALLLDVVNAGFIFEVTAVRRDHHDDGPNGHAGGRGADGWPLNSRTEGDWVDAASPHFADFLEVLARSPWRFQVGLAGSANTEANMTAALAGPNSVPGQTAFVDSGGDHVHCGSIVG